MENEIMNNEMELDVIDLENENEVTETECESDAGKAIAVAVALVAGATLAIAAIVRKNKGKFTEWQIKRLEKKGYMVTKLEKEDEDEAEGCDDSSDETEE